MKTTLKTLALAFFVSIVFASCKKETVETTTTDVINGDTVTTTSTETSLKSGVDLETNQAKTEWEKAKEDLQAAIANGDKKTQEAAQKAADEAETTWNKLKSEVKENTEEATKDLKDAKEKAKEQYNEALEKAKIK
jgi:DNA polymerase III delta prime subunit